MNRSDLLKAAPLGLLAACGAGSAARLIAPSTGSTALLGLGPAEECRILADKDQGLLIATECPSWIPLSVGIRGWYGVPDQEHPFQWTSGTLEATYNEGYKGDVTYKWKFNGKNREWTVNPRKRWPVMMNKDGRALYEFTLVDKEHALLYHHENGSLLGSFVRKGDTIEGRVESGPYKGKSIKYKHKGEDRMVEPDESLNCAAAQVFWAAICVFVIAICAAGPIGMGTAVMLAGALAAAYTNMQQQCAQ